MPRLSSVVYAAGCIAGLVGQISALPGRPSVSVGLRGSSISPTTIGSSSTAPSSSVTSWSATATATEAAITISSTTSIVSDVYITATATDENAVVVEATGVAYLTDVTIYKTGDSSDDDDSSFTILNAAVGVKTYGTLYMYSSTIATDGGSANGLHTYEDGADVYLYDVTVSASGDGAHGISTAGGYIYGENLVITTEDQRGSAIATDNGGGTIVVDTATVYTYGSKSALVYSTGNITVSSLTGSASVAPACVIDDSNSFTLVDPDISSGTEEYGVFQIVSTGSTNSDVAYAYVTGGSIAEIYGTYGLIDVGNIEAIVFLDDVSVTTESPRIYLPRLHSSRTTVPNLTIHPKGLRSRLLPKMDHLILTTRILLVLKSLLPRLATPDLAIIDTSILKTAKVRVFIRNRAFLKSKPLSTL
ncbi:uncharacterized protein N7496_012757 [Penicillium cataractarum]|uniref:Uncharacterized protein n=1 Tax=Penicillium cataractarum TaxID=2100454 RepID=A0A9W9R9M7_9EURO|nr:uncharacterized protein N7496_012757 [Penicillium cataractarum]KAJ5355545.1 hypothetical protein N7496_012757 [Penicillium cataractarum]